MSNRKAIKIPSKNEKLAEFIGIMLGDGNIFMNKDVAQIRIAGDRKSEMEFMINFVKPLIVELFNIVPRIVFHKATNEVFVAIENRNLAEFFLSIGLSEGNKIKKQISIPSWNRNDKTLLKACLRGLIDTDGTVFRMSKRDFDNPRISFKTNNRRLLEDVRNSLIELGFHPSKIIINQIFISRLSDIKNLKKS
jgi:intein/homing endonuclease